MGEVLDSQGLIEGRVGCLAACVFASGEGGGDAQKTLCGAHMCPQSMLPCNNISSHQV